MNIDLYLFNIEKIEREILNRYVYLIQLRSKRKDLIKIGENIPVTGTEKVILELEQEIEQLEARNVLLTL